MRPIRIMVLFVVLAGCLGILTGCADNFGTVATGGDFIRFVDVYVGEGTSFTLTGGVKPTGPILVFAEDRVIFNNLGADKVVLTLPDGMFAKDERIVDNRIVIEPKKRVVLKVISEGKLEGLITGKTDPGGNTIDGSPDLKVGDEP